MQCLLERNCRKVFVPTTIVATDSDDDIIKFYQAGGDLPPGVTFNQKTGRISGIVTPEQDLTDTRVTGWDMNPFDAPATQWDDIYRSRSVSRYYQFSVRVTDGATETERQFTSSSLHWSDGISQTRSTPVQSSYSPPTTLKTSTAYKKLWCLHS